MSERSETQLLTAFETARKAHLAADDDLLKHFSALCVDAEKKGDINEVRAIVQRMPESVARFHLWRKYFT